MLHGFHCMQPGIHCSMLHGFHCMQPGYITPCCMQSSAFNLDPLCYAAMNPLHSIGIHLAKLHVIHCIYSGCISQRCMEYTALNLDAWNPPLNWYQLHNSAGNPLHSIGIHCSMLHGFHCIQPGYTAPGCMQSTAFTRDAFHNAAWNRLHSIMPHGIQCIQSGSIGQCCMEATAFNRDTMHHSA